MLINLTFLDKQTFSNLQKIESELMNVNKIIANSTGDLKEIISSLFENLKKVSIFKWHKIYFVLFKSFLKISFNNSFLDWLEKHWTNWGGLNKWKRGNSIWGSRSLSICDQVVWIWSVGWHFQSARNNEWWLSSVCEQQRWKCYSIPWRQQLVDNRCWN